MPAGVDPTGGIESAVSQGLSTIEGGVELFTSLSDERKQREALRNLHPAFYKIQDEYKQNLNNAAITASGGTPQSELDSVTGGYQKGLGAGISGTLQGGGSVNDINKLFDTYNKSIDKTYAESAEQHLKNMEYFAKQNADYAGQKTTQWALNEYKPKQDKLKQITENISADKTNEYAGLNSMIGTASAAGTSSQNNPLLDKIFGTKTGTGGNESVSSGIDTTF